MADPSLVPVPGPLEPFAANFASSLVRQGYRRQSALIQIHLFAQLSTWLVDEGLEPGELCATDVERFLAARRAAGAARYVSGKAMRAILTYLREEGVLSLPPVLAASGPVDVTLEHYRQYLAQERGLESATARLYVHLVRPFVSARVSPDGLTIDWESLRAADVIAFVVARTPHQSRGAAKLTVTALRSLLGFLHVDGRIARSLTGAVPSVAGWRLAGLPKGLKREDVQAIFATCDRRGRTGRRDFAVLTMLVRLALRAGEVAALRLDDIDWRTGTMVVRGKGRHVEQLPFPRDVGDAVVGYLRRGRPVTAMDRALFVRVKAPHRGLTALGVSAIVATAARRAGLGRIHAHRLRHTAAIQLLRAGAPLPEIGQLLRHRRAQTTAIYAKVDRAALQTIAQPWPGGVA
jgi:site-specific recombinase XerD